MKLACARETKHTSPSLSLSLFLPCALCLNTDYSALPFDMRAYVCGGVLAPSSLRAARETNFLFVR